jgi:acyl dehydratase
MNEYCYDDVIFDMTESFSVKITKDMRQVFEAMSGDNNPIHVNEKYRRVENRNINAEIGQFELSCSF